MVFGFQFRWILDSNFSGFCWWFLDSNFVDFVGDFWIRISWIMDSIFGGF